MQFDLKKYPHQRFNPLRREWVLVSPHRAVRPWMGQMEEVRLETPPSYDTDCYLCPGNERAGGVRNPHYEDTFVFENDFPALVKDTPHGEMNQEDLIISRSERGICRVVCFSPRHDLALPRMETDKIRGVVDTWVDQYVELGTVPWIQYVQIFENRGALMGCSNPHPHCQIWANEHLPNELQKEQDAFLCHMDEKGICMLCRYLELEELHGERFVQGNGDFVVLVPYWAVWPYETIVISRRHVTGIDQLSSWERDSLATILQRLTVRYDNLFSTPFPYSMGFHQRPTDGHTHSEWHLHAHFYPPLLRSATIRKFMVGYEMLAAPQRDITVEIAAEHLRRSPEGSA